MKAVINRVLDHSFVDGPGNRTAIFFQGCNLDCMYCHNPETICNAHENAKLMTVDEVFEIVMKNKNFIRGITCSGGECTMQHEFLTELFKKVRKIGLTCLVDTNGAYIDFEKYPQFVDVCDGFMLDIKATDDEIHKKLTGKSNELIMKNAVYLAKIGKLHEIRTVMARKMLRNEQTITQIGEKLAVFGKINYKLIKFRPYGVRQDFINLATPTDEEMLSLKVCAERFNFNILLT